MNAVFSPALLLSIVGLALPALASPNLPGEACPAYLVVQNNDCTVTHYTRCEGDGSGTHTELVFDRDGMIFSALYTDQGRWLETNAYIDNIHEVFESAVDPVSLDTLLRERVDTFEFTLSHAENGGAYRPLTVVGADVLTGEEVVIDGVRLSVVTTDLRILEADGTTYYQSRGQQYLSPDMRLWFLGSDSVLGDDGSVTNYDSSPVTFRFPGQPGFDTTEPLYGCADGPAPQVPALPDRPGANNPNK